jgi:hypothetical protein
MYTYRHEVAASGSGTNSFKREFGTQATVPTNVQIGPVLQLIL